MADDARARREHRRALRVLERGLGRLDANGSRWDRYAAALDVLRTIDPYQAGVLLRFASAANGREAQ